MLLDGSSLDLDDVDARIAERLRDADRLDSNVEDACGQFEVVLARVQVLLPGDDPVRRWCLDDFMCDAFHRRDQVVTLSGVPFWLQGGEGCDLFRIDVALDRTPLLYSYKFSNRRTGRQILYVGKTPSGWVVSGTRPATAADGPRKGARGRRAADRGTHNAGEARQPNG